MGRHRFGSLVVILLIGAFGITTADASAIPLKSFSNSGILESENFLVFANKEIELIFERATGQIISLHDMTKDIELIDSNADSSGFLPFGIETLEPVPGQDEPPAYQVVRQDFSGTAALATEPDFVSVDSRLPGGQGLVIRWLLGDGWVFEGRADLPAKGAFAEFTAHAEAPGKMIYSVSYPVIYGAANLSADGASDFLALPWESGVEISDPLRVANTPDKDNAYPFTRIHYPGGHDLALPLVAYYSHEADGGFAMYARDSEWTERMFSLYPFDPDQENGLPSFVFEALNWDVDGAGGAGLGVMDLDQPIRIESMIHGDWAEAAEIYRRWEETQPVASSRIAERSEGRRRIYEKMSLSVFGLSGKANQSEWMRVFHDLFANHVPGEGVLFIPGWDFHANGDNFGGPSYAFYQAGKQADLWLPYQGFFLSMTNTARVRGDLVYPFLYDLLVHDGFPGWDGWSGSRGASGDEGAPWINHTVVMPSGELNAYNILPGINGNEHQICPADPVTQDFYQWRSDLLRTGGVDGGRNMVDGLYFDISGSVAERACFDRLAGYEHGHAAMGWGRFMIDAEREMLRNLLGAERRFSFGQESATEPFFDLVDFSHLGLSGDGPYRSSVMDKDQGEPVFEGINAMIMDGRAKQIPMVEYVNHAFGPLRTGGKVQISNEIGDAWYWVAAYNYVHGGILELIYFNTPADLFEQIDPNNVTCPGGYPCAFQTGWVTGSDRGWSYDHLKQADPEKIDFLARAADLRVRLGAPYLTMGRMLPPPVLDPKPADVDLGYDFYSSINGDQRDHTGVFRAESAVVSAFADPNDPTRVALFAANVTEEDISTNLVFDRARLGVAGKVRAVMSTAGKTGGKVLGNFKSGADGTIRIPVTLPARSLVKVELLGPGAGHHLRLMNQ